MYPSDPRSYLQQQLLEATRLFHFNAGAPRPVQSNLDLQFSLAVHQERLRRELLLKPASDSGQQPIPLYNHLPVPTLNLMGEEGQQRMVTNQMAQHVMSGTADNVAPKPAIQGVNRHSTPEFEMSTTQAHVSNSSLSDLSEDSRKGKKSKSSKPPKPPQKKGNTVSEMKWMAMFEDLKAYKENFGDCIVPRGYPANPKLASWVAEQRKQYKLSKDGKTSSITEKRIELLQSLDFAWNAQEAAWDRHVKDLGDFRSKRGHCNVPLNDPEFPKLGLWVKEQRRHYTLLKQNKASHMTESRVEQLDRLDFCWDTHEASWMEKYKQLKNFKNRFGNCAVSSSSARYSKLGTWVHHQRRQYRRFQDGEACHITQERISMLNELGFEWSISRKRAASELSDETDDRSSSSSSVTSERLPPKKRAFVAHST